MPGCGAPLLATECRRSRYESPSTSDRALSALSCSRVLARWDAVRPTLRRSPHGSYHVTRLGRGSLSHHVARLGRLLSHDRL